MAHDFQAEIDAVGRIDAVPTILDVVCHTTGMGFAAVARVTEDRWIACSVKDDIAFGLKPGGELKVESTICHEIRQNREAVVIDHVAEDDIWRQHHTPLAYGFQSYISMPILLPDGRFFGTLCAIDPKPAKLRTPETVGMFRLFAELIAFHLDAIEQLASSEASLRTERETSELREQFIAVLGHDLRNPLAAIQGGARMLAKTPLNERATTIVGLIKDSASRMSGLIDNVLDFARGRLGGGIAVTRDSGARLQPVLDQVVAELQGNSGDRAIETRFALGAPVDCDTMRIGQLFSNLLANALTHGAPAAPIQAAASTSGGVFELSVTNTGAAIAADALGRLFQPFFRGEVRSSQQGLGLGLYIASEIARAHDGTLTATSTPAETRFTFRMPLTGVR